MARPVKPAIRPYHFAGDSLPIMGPASVASFLSECFKAYLMDIPGEAQLRHTIKEAPHRAVINEYYPAVSGTICSVVVYTPPGYYKDTARNIPVLYLIGDTAAAVGAICCTGREGVQILIQHLLPLAA